MSAQNNIFQSTGRQPPPKSLLVSSENPSNSYELHLISQYLTFNRQSTQGCVENIENKELIPVQQDENMKDQQAETQAKEKSSFHNFQKHLINTLKNNIKLKKIQNIERSRLRIAYQLWEYFTSSVKSTKKLLYTILGDNFINNLQFKKGLNAQRSELIDSINKSSEEDLKNCQVYLRNVIVKQSRNLLKGKLLQGRRIHRSQDFKCYFQHFVKQMEEGTIMRRMPNDKKRKFIQVSIKEEKI